MDELMQKKMLNLTRLSRDKLNLEIVDLSKMAYVVAAELMLTEPQRRVNFKIAKGVTCTGDPKLLEMVLEYLLGNSWKQTCNRKLAVIEFGTSEIDGNSACFIRDNGIGFDMTDTSTYFDCSRQLSDGTEITAPGLGLSAVQQIVKLHGGRVWAEGEVGKGATFTFTLA